MAELTGPNHCAECGCHLSEGTVHAGDAGPLVLSFNEQLIEVPGLYVCTECAGAIMVGEKACTVTPERAAEFLTGNYAPILAAFMTEAYNNFVIARNRFQDVKEAAEKLDPTVQVELALFPLD